MLLANVGDLNPGLDPPLTTTEFLELNSPLEVMFGGHDGVAASRIAVNEVQTSLRSSQRVDEP